MIINLIIFFIIGVFCSTFFINIGYRLPLNISVFSSSICDSCFHKLSLKEKIPVLSYIFQKGKCNYCKQKISKLYIIFEIATGILFALTYYVFIKENNPYIKLSLGLIFVSTMIIITYSDIKYMIIPDELLLVSSSLIIVLKVFLGFASEEISNILDAGYMIIFMLIDALIMFVIMYVIKFIGDMLFKKESLGGGDVKMMCLVSIVLGYKMSIFVIFLASFLALPISIINAYKKNEAMLPYGPYLAIASVLLFLCQINFDMVLNFIH